MPLALAPELVEALGAYRLHEPLRVWTAVKQPHCRMCVPSAFLAGTRTVEQLNSTEIQAGTWYA
jgi:hypothetical protein